MNQSYGLFVLVCACSQTNVLDTLKSYDSNSFWIHATHNKKIRKPANYCVLFGRFCWWLFCDLFVKSCHSIFSPMTLPFFVRISRHTQHFFLSFFYGFHSFFLFFCHCLHLYTPFFWFSLFCTVILYRIYSSVQFLSRFLFLCCALNLWARSDPNCFFLSSLSRANCSLIARTILIKYVICNTWWPFVCWFSHPE